MIAMINPTDYDTLLTLARAYPAPDWREEIVQQAALYLLQGSDLPAAYADAVRYADTMRRGQRGDSVSQYERGTVSLDELYEMVGDALNAYAIEAPTLSKDQRHYDYKASGKATLREMEKGIEELGLEDDGTFQTVLRNLYQRGILTTVEDLAVDIGREPERQAGLLRLILSSATRTELEERGYKSSELYGATQWLTQYYATPPSR